MISVGTRIVGSTARTSISVFIRRSAAAALGLAEWRKYLARDARVSGSRAALGARLVRSISPQFARVSTMSASRSSRDGAHGYSGVRRRLAKPLRRTRARVRDGCDAAKVTARLTPSENPRSAAFSEPRASITARTSSIRSSSVGSSEIDTGSDRPVPRLSKRMRRENDDRRCRKPAKAGCSHDSSTLDTQPGIQTRSIGPSPATWYAIRRSPETAYLVRGTAAMPPHGTAELPRDRANFGPNAVPYIRQLGKRLVSSLDSVWPHGYCDRHDASADLS